MGQFRGDKAGPITREYIDFVEAVQADSATAA
jgi:hypothetical protein